MKYKIINKYKEIIAEFKYEHDRDVCFGLLNGDGDLSTTDGKY